MNREQAEQKLGRAMNNDRELLELAAKAEGINPLSVACGPGTWWDSESRTTYTCWNSLTSDGDALRLAVKRGINLSFSMPDRVCAWCDAIDDWVVEMYADHATHEDATRRAITRAAASIGRAMK